MQTPSEKNWLQGPRPTNWWTGKPPIFPDCPGVDESGRIHSLPQIQFKNITRQDLLDYFHNSWTLTEVLFSALQGEEAFTRAPSHQLRHPLIFYYCHPAVLYVNKLHVAGLIPGPVDTYFENLFEVGVDEMSWDDMSKNEMKWPSIREVHQYRQTIYNLVKNLILTDPRLDPVKFPISSETPAWALVMGFEHERIHFETSSVLMRELPIQFLKKPQQWPEIQKDLGEKPLSSELLHLDPAPIKLGKPYDFPSFGWDNEYGLRQQDVPDFEVSRTLVTNEQFLEFVRAGGYSEERFWTTDGWKWRNFRNTKSPTFWVSRGPNGLHEYQLRTIFELIEFQGSWPVVVNYHEANAYCVWKTEKEKSSTPFRLLSEAEHHRLRDLAHPKATWNRNLLCGAETSAYRFSSNGVYDLFGNVWQWVEDEFNPLSGFKTHPHYEDFSTPCFDGKHQMILGGSFVSTGAEAEEFARFHFRPHFFQHAGFRIARGPQRTAFHHRNVGAGGSDYESSDLLSQYLLLHLAQENEIFPFASAPREAFRFPQRCAQAVIETAQKLRIPMSKALDIGCAVGGSSFALSEFYSEVVGVDLSATFISAAKKLKDNATLEFLRKDQGELTTKLRVQRPPTSRPDRLRFMEADACALPKELFDFDAVLMANLLCRLPNPRACLEAMSGPQGVVKRGGLLVLASPYSWLEQHTSKNSWLGGQTQEGQRLSSPEEIQRLLNANFRLLEEREMPLLIREHERKYQYIVSHLMIWQRTS
jgi:5-histidylcysteine sulfoxide synthase/putative 4-mercaptohistidine N1-methyltranferase